MKKDSQKTKMLFRYDTQAEWKGTIFALMPYQVERNGDITSYQHIGQHSAADYDHRIRTSRPATPKEAKDLKNELKGLGYNIQEIKKRNYKTYLSKYKQANNL